MDAQPQNQATHPEGTPPVLKGPARIAGRTLAIAAAILAASTALRITAAGSDLWFDEVWSLWLAEKISNPIEIFSALRETNNHHANTLWLWLTGPSENFLVLRAPALLLGSASVLLAGAIARPRGRAEALFAMTLVGGSYLMIDSASEARGYAPMLGFALLALFALERVRQRRAAKLGALLPAALVFNAACLLALAFQASFAIAYAAFGIYWVCFALRERPSIRSWLLEGGLLHALPLAGFGLLYLAWGQHASIGGTLFPTLRVLSRTAMLAVGLEGGTAMMAIGSTLAAVLLVAGLFLVAGRDMPRALFYAVGIVGAPCVLLWQLEPSFLAPRYFLPSVLFFLLLGAEVLAALWRRGGARRAAVCAGLVLFLVGNLHSAWPLLTGGRGDFARALSIIEHERGSSEVSIGARFDFRHRLLFGYYARRSAPTLPLRFVAGEDWPDNGPDWLVVALPNPDGQVAETVRGPRGNPYRRAAAFEAIRGREPQWFLYRAIRSGPRSETR